MKIEQRIIRRRSLLIVMASLEVLPNEILIQCFEYLNTCTLFHAFNQLNSRFNQLIRQMSLCIDFEDISKSIFDEFSMILSQDETMKNQVYSLHLPNDDRCLQSKEFWSRFSCEDFPRLQIFESNIFLKPGQEDLERVSYVPMKINLQAFHNLQKLSMFELRYSIWKSGSTSSITHFTLSVCEGSEFFYFLKTFPMLKYLHIHKLVDHSNYGLNEFLDDQRHLHLTELIIDNFKGSFEIIELSVKQTPNLQSLTIVCLFSWIMFDPDRWERLITQSLPHLNHFKFVGSTFKDQLPAQNIFEQFQSAFWRVQHQWFVEMIFDETLVTIYTIPYMSKDFMGSLNERKLDQTSEDQMNTFVHVTHVTACVETLTETCQCYFPNLKNLQLALQTVSALCKTIYRIYAKEIQFLSSKPSGYLHFFPSRE